MGYFQYAHDLLALALKPRHSIPPRIFICHAWNSDSSGKWKSGTIVPAHAHCVTNANNAAKIKIIRQAAINTPKIAINLSMWTPYLT